MPSTLIQVPKQKLKHPPLQVHTLGDKVLRQPAKRINKVTPEIRQLAIQMLQTMYSEDGIGLAAPQVGINKQLIVIDIELKDQAKPPLVMINPEIKSSGGSLVIEEEGCLSIPEVFFDVQRPDQVQVAYRDLDGRPQILQADGLLARVIQHEMDHLQGVLFVDRVQNSSELAKSLTKHGFNYKDVEPIKD